MHQIRAQTTTTTAEKGIAIVHQSTLHMLTDARTSMHGHYHYCV